jgi:hypothetical protein
MSNPASFAIFALGAAVGATAAYLCVKKTFERIAQEEIDSVKEAFYKRQSAVRPHFRKKYEAAMCDEDTKKDIAAYSETIRKRGYTNYSGFGGERKDEKPTFIPDEKEPYVISPDEYGEIDDYEKLSFTYYDGILMDDNDDIVYNIEEVVGFDALNRFGEYEDDSVFVRNERLKCDYEITLDQGKYSDIIKENPRRTEE